jgi:hypothetical protein
VKSYEQLNTERGCYLDRNCYAIGSWEEKRPLQSGLHSFDAQNSARIPIQPVAGQEDGVTALHYGRAKRIGDPKPRAGR